MTNNNPTNMESGKNAGQETGIEKNQQKKSAQSNGEIENNVENDPGAQNSGGDESIKGMGMRKSSQTGVNKSSDHPA
ncbi:MAG TPA: hypothetical protein VEF76_06515 [Patescibacteria group bacterium]|nr:hypothetical protein [Patescibacteria group bacterium]